MKKKPAKKRKQDPAKAEKVEYFNPMSSDRPLYILDPEKAARLVAAFPDNASPTRH
jgi:hypothetical protein